MSEFSVPETEQLLTMNKQVEIMLADVIHLPYMKTCSTSVPDVYMEFSEAFDGILRVKL